MKIDKHPHSQDGASGLLTDLLRVPSINPPGNEREVSRILGSVWASAGYEVQYDDFGDGRSNVVGRRRWGPGPSLLLNGHMDVQPPSHGWSVDPFGAVVRDGRIYGQGAEDMKAGLAAFTTAAVNYARTTAGQHGELILTAVADELCGGSNGTGRLIDYGLQPDFVVVCEPTGRELYLAHRGALWLRLHVTGTSSHGGRPWLGTSAIGGMLEWLTSLEAMAPPTLRNSEHGLLPDPTLNIGTIKGGHKINVVADECTADIDLRFLPGENVTDIVDEVRRLAAACIDREVEADIEILHVVEPMETPEDAPLVKLCQGAYEEVVGCSVALGASAGFQDAHYFSRDMGVETVMFGPFGDPATSSDPYPSLSGQPDESVSISALTTSTRIYEAMISRVLCSA